MRKMSVLVFFCTIVSLAIVIVPALLIQPFESQSGQDLTISYILRKWSPTLTSVFLLIVAFFGVRLWRTTNKWLPKTGFFLAILLTAVSAWFARQNHFEWMFHPQPNPAYASIKDADFVSDEDMLLTVTMNGESAAYPVRQLAYHHLVQDVVGGVPIVATY